MYAPYDEDCFSITIDNPGYGVTQTHLVSRVVIHLPGGGETVIVKSDLLRQADGFVQTLREKLGGRR